MRSPFWRWLWLAASLLALVVICVALFPGSVLYWGSPHRIERYLRDQTPIGSTQDAVVMWLRGRSSSANIAVAIIPPHSTYPPTVVGGTSFIHSIIASYRVLFTTDVEAFYVFDASAHLVDIGVRTTTDAL